MTGTPPGGDPHLEPTLRSGPGRRLREAREALGMERRDAAARLRLDPRVILALEEDDYDHLPAPAFVRGYIRSYARLLGTPEDPLLAAYGDQGVAAPEVHPTGTIRSGAHPGEGLWRWASYLIAASIVAGVLAYWQGQRGAEPQGQAVAGLTGGEVPARSGDDPAQGPMADADPALFADPGPDAPAGLPPGADFEPPLEVPLPPGSGVEEAAAAAPVALGAQPDGAVEWPSEGPGLEAPAAPPTGEPEGDGLAADAEVARADLPPAPTRTRVPDAEPAADASPGPVPGDPGRATLVLRFGAESWLDVKDRSGKRLAYETVKAGRTKTLTGLPPLRVVLGNAHAVSVRYAGEAFEIAPYTNGNVARFVVGSAADAR